MFEILHRDWNLKPIFTQKWAPVDMNWAGLELSGGGVRGLNTQFMSAEAYFWVEIGFKF